MNDSTNLKVDQPTGLMGTQFALAVSQGVVKALDDAGVSKTQMFGWGQKEIEGISKGITQSVLSLSVIDPWIWIEEKRKISHFYKTCFNDKKWKNPNWDHVAIPTIEGLLKRLEFIFPEMAKAIDVAFDAYVLRFGKDKVWKVWNEQLSKIIDFETVQPRPKQNYAMLHVGGDEPDLLKKSYNDGISENIIFMTPLEGIISAFRYRFETGKMYDVIGVTRLSTLDRSGSAMSMCGSTGGEFGVDGRGRDLRDPDRGLRQVSF